MDLVQVCLPDRSFEVLKMAPSRQMQDAACFNPDVMENSSVSLLSWNTCPDIHVYLHAECRPGL